MLKSFLTNHFPFAKERPKAFRILRFRILVFQPLLVPDLQPNSHVSIPTFLYRRMTAAEQALITERQGHHNRPYRASMVTVVCVRVRTAQPMGCAAPSEKCHQLMLIGTVAPAVQCCPFGRVRFAQRARHHPILTVDEVSAKRKTKQSPGVPFHSWFGPP